MERQLRLGDLILQELLGILEAAAGFDRERRRVTYGNYIRMMGLTVKATLDQGDIIFRQGDPVKYFYCLLSGDVDVVRQYASGDEKVVNTLHAGDFFGENSLLAGSTVRSVTTRCRTPVEILKLAKSDFEAGFLGAGSWREGRLACMLSHMEIESDEAGRPSSRFERQNSRLTSSSLIRPPAR